MRIALLSPVTWRTPPRQYGPWEQVVSCLAEQLVAKGIDVTLFATGDSVTKARLAYCIDKPVAETPGADAKVSECLHISNLMERAAEFDIIHNHFDFLPLTYSRLTSTPLLTTIHGFSSPAILPVYQKYNGECYYVSISNADRDPSLKYTATVYNGIDTSAFTFCAKPKDYLLFFGRIHPEKGTLAAIQVAKQCGKKLLLAGLVQDTRYFETYIKPQLDNEHVIYLGNCGPEQRDELLGNARALLHLVNFDEPFGLSVAEAMCCGTPVIAFKRGAMPELIENAKTGFIVNTKEEAAASIEKLPGIDRSYCSQRAIRLFSGERMADDYIQVYNHILQQKIR